jgi:P27 family predicted phage terminase small subunit
MPTRAATHIKVYRGTTPRDRQRTPSPLARLDIAPGAPEDLPADAVAYWDKLAPICAEMGTLTRADFEALSLLCRLNVRKDGLLRTLEADGEVLIGQNGARKTHPAARGLESAVAQILKLYTEFGLAPRARGGVDHRPMRAGSAFANNGRPILNKLEKYTTR